MTDDSPQTNMTEVAAGIAQEHVDLKNDLRELIGQLEDGEAHDQWFARELQNILEDYE